LHDAITAEKAGVIATAIITDYPFAVIAHPMSNNSEAVLRAKAEDAVRQCLAIWRSR
jgi:hypothetical protein